MWCKHNIWKSFFQLYYITQQFSLEYGCVYTELYLPVHGLERQCDNAFRLLLVRSVKDCYVLVRFTKEDRAAVKVTLPDFNC